MGKNMLLASCFHSVSTPVCHSSADNLALLTSMDVTKVKDPEKTSHTIPRRTLPVLTGYASYAFGGPARDIVRYTYIAPRESRDYARPPAKEMTASQRSASGSPSSSRIGKICESPR